MASTNRVSSYAYFKTIFFFFFVPKFLIKTITLLVSTFQYHKQQKEIFLAQRYKKVNGWLKELISFKNIDYVFVDRKNLLNTQILLICNKEIDLDNVYIFTNIFYDDSFVLHLKEFKKFHNMLKLLDINYDKEKLSVFIKHKFSVVITVKNQEEALNSDLIKENYLSIHVVNITEEKKKFFGKVIKAKFSPAIKPSSFLQLNEKALIDKISSYL